MSKDHLSYDELMQIAEFFESSTHFTEFHLKVGDIEIDLRKKSPEDAVLPARAKPQPGAVTSATPGPDQDGAADEAQN
jgi:hypothetical protein